MSPRRENILALIDEEDVIELCSRMVRANSVNPPGNELAVANIAAEYLQRAGLEVELIHHSAGRASVAARLKGQGNAPGLLYSGHIDTVPPGAEPWQRHPFSGEQADGKIWGRGASDMKGGAAAMLAAARAAAIHGLQGDLVLALSAGEEVDFLGAQALTAHPWLQNLRAVCVAEPTSNELVLAEKGGLWLELTTAGKTAHGAYPQLGVNAILNMLRLLDEFQKLPFSFQEHPLLGGFTRSINTIEGGVKTNVVPDRCSVTVDIRTVPGQDNREIVRKVEDLIRRMEREDENFRAGVHIINSDTPALSTPPDDPFARQFARILADITGKDPIPAGVSYFTDAAIYVPRLGIPMLICGPGIAGLAHQPDEYVEIQKLVQAAQIYALAASEILK